MRCGSRDDSVDPVVQVLSHVFQTLHPVERVWNLDRDTTKLGYAQFERNSVPESRRSPDQGDTPSLEHRWRLPFDPLLTESLGRFHQVD